MDQAPKKAEHKYVPESSVIPHEFNKPKKDQLVMPTWGLLVILFIAFFVLKGFIYIPDESRKGK